MIGGLLRFWHLGEWSFWIDEVFTLRDAHKLSLKNWQNVPNPIPYLAVKLSITLSSDNEWSSRLIPCIAGVVSIPAVFGLGRTLFNWRIGLLSSTFMACSSWHLFWTQNARYPVFTLLFAVLTAWLFYLSLERNSTLLTIGALLSCSCLILSHTLSVVIVPALAVYAAICLLENPNKKRWLNLLLFFVPFAIPVLALILPQIRSYLFSGWGRNEWQRSPLYIVLTLVHGVSVPVAAAALVGFIATLSNKQTRFLFCYAGIPLLLFLVASKFQNVAGYYLFWTIPAYFILAGVGCEKFVWKATTHQSEEKKANVLSYILIATLLSQTYLYFQIENGGRPRWREAFEAIQAEKKPTDKVVLSEPEMGRYYLPELTAVYIGGLLDDAEKFEKQWETSGRDRLWFIVDVASFNVFDADVAARSWIRKRGHLVETLPAFSRAKDRTIHIYLLE